MSEVEQQFWAFISNPTWPQVVLFVAVCALVGWVVWVVKTHE